MNILFAFIILALLGLVLGVSLAFADKKLAVEKDERLIALEASMPGANCGGCGFAGCAAYAEAVFNGEQPAGLCPVGGNELSKKMGQIMGIAVEEKERMVAFVHCSGNAEVTKQEYSYAGIKDCNAAALLHGGPNGCKEGCLHLGSCMEVCPANAIYRDEKGNILVDKEACIGCQKCTKVCPNGVIKMVPYSAEYLVACNNHLPGGKVKKVCSVGCIGCKICQLKVADSCFKVENFLSVNDFSKDQAAAEKAAELCPQKCIIKRG